MSYPAARLTAALADRYRIQRELGQGGDIKPENTLLHDKTATISCSSSPRRSCASWFA